MLGDDDSGDNGISADIIASSSSAQPPPSSSNSSSDADSSVEAGAISAAEVQPGDETFAADDDDEGIDLGLAHWDLGGDAEEAGASTSASPSLSAPATEGSTSGGTPLQLRTPSQKTASALKKDTPLIPSAVGTTTAGRRRLKRQQAERIVAKRYADANPPAPQDVQSPTVRIIGDVAAAREDADSLLEELISSTDAEATALARRFLQRREETKALRKEMTVNDDLSSAVLDIQGPDQGAIFYGQFDSTRTAAGMEMLTVEQHNHMRLQRAAQTGGVAALKATLRAIEREGLSGLDAHGSRSARGQYDVSALLDPEARAGRGSGRGSDVAMTEADEERLKKEEMRRMRAQTDKWSDRAIVQDHFAHQTVKRGRRVEERDTLSRRMNQKVSTDYYHVYEANVNDPRNAALVAEYHQKRDVVMGRRTAHLLSPEQRALEASRGMEAEAPKGGRGGGRGRR